MLRRIILSASMIAMVGAAWAGATGAFFSDAETSTGNTFSAGSLVLSVDDTQHYAGLVCTNVATEQGPANYEWQQDPSIGPNPTTRPDLLGQPCTGTWLPGPLGPSTQFFNFGDLKPGDQGENTVSLHVTNDAWACLNIGTNANNENGVNGPELAAGDNPALNGPQDGELAQNVSVFAWRDTASTSGATLGDNIYQPSLGEVPLFGGNGIQTLSSFGGTTTIALADSTTGGGPLSATTTNYVGIAWCVGVTNVNNTTGAISCDGGPVTNIIQTDSATATVQFNVTQSRNNPTFTCNAPIVVGVNDLESNILNATSSGKWFFYDDTNNVINNALGTFVTGPGTPFFGTGSAQMTLAGATSRTFLSTAQFAGVPLASISQWSFGEWADSGSWSTSEAPFVRFNVDFTGSPAYQSSLVYVPSQNGTVTQNTWQQWDLINGGNSKWNYSGANWPAATAGPDFGGPVTPGTTLRTWSQILADYPGIRMHLQIPQVGIRVGEPGPAGFTANVDFFSINTGSGLKTFNFGN